MELKCIAERWKPLDLPHRDIMGPYDDELIVMRIINGVWKSGPEYVVGRMSTEHGVSWFNCVSGASFLPRRHMKEGAEIAWCRLPEG